MFHAMSFRYDLLIDVTNCVTFFFVTGEITGITSQFDRRKTLQTA